ncbi:MAG: hypothetical protein M3220_08050 [Chloroflexota bacterium]|nr:hypothetical protein [Chloroflexota bacterium]
MSEQWIQRYVHLAFEIDKHFRQSADSWYVDYYYGPAEWRAAVESEPPHPAAALVSEAVALTEAIPAQGFAPQRATYLEKQVRAMETIARKLNGETFPLQEETERVLDVRPSWIPETQFEEGLALYDEALPGTGPLKERYAAWRERHELEPGHGELLATLMEQTLAEARRRTRRLIGLPRDEEVETKTITGKAWGAANWYLGNYRSRMELNTDLPTNLAMLVYLMCHEAYPGHHTEFALKEQALVREQGLLEYTISPVLSPQLTISEGIAELAPEMIFAPDEIEEWSREHLYAPAGIEDDGTDGAKIRAAERLLREAAGNAALMLDQGEPEEEVLAYLRRYTIEPEVRVQKALAFLKDPLMRPYIFSYTYGRRLLEPLLQGPNRLTTLRRLLTEQLYPSLLGVGVGSRLAEQAQQRVGEDTD